MKLLKIMYNKGFEEFNRKLYVENEKTKNLFIIE